MTAVNLKEEYNKTRQAFATSSAPEQTQTPQLAPAYPWGSGSGTAGAAYRPPGYHFASASPLHTTTSHDSEAYQTNWLSCSPLLMQTCASGGTTGHSHPPLLMQTCASGSGDGLGPLFGEVAVESHFRVAMSAANTSSATQPNLNALADEPFSRSTMSVWNDHSATQSNSQYGLKSIFDITSHTTQSLSTHTAPPAPPTHSSRGPSLFFPTFSRDDELQTLLAWHSRARLQGGREGLLVDVGAHDNLVGERWVRRVIALRAARGLFDVRFEKMDVPLKVEGVGKEAQTCIERAIVPVALSDGQEGTFTAPVVPDSDIPALYGQRSLRANRAIIDTIHSRLYQLGPGEFKIIYPSGTRIFDLVDSPSGHMLLPVTEFDALPRAGRSQPSASSSL